MSAERQQTRLDADHADRRRGDELSELFRVHCSPAFTRLVRIRALDEDPTASFDTSTTGSSLDTCEKVGTSSPEPPDGPQISDARDVLLQAMSRSPERQSVITALVEEGEIPSAKRMAYCGRQSVQLECSTCGSTDNFVPITCDVRLCWDCGKKRQGELINKYLSAVQEWDDPALMTLTIENSPDLEAVDEIRDALRRFLDRVIPTEGETERDGEHKSWCWLSDGGIPRTDHWKQALCRPGRDASRARYEASRLETEYVDQGRGIPMDEIIDGGLYGIDVKEQWDGTYNVHIHALIDALYCPQPAYSAVWEDVTGAPVMDVRRVTDSKHDDVEDALAEVIGYAVKPPEFESLDAEVEYLTRLKGSKLIQPFGSLHGNTPDVDGDLLCGECGDAPLWWDYVGLVDEAYDTMTPSWEETGDRPPPEDEDGGDEGGQRG